MKALIVGRHKLSGKENLEVVEQENINFPAHSGPCQDIIMGLMQKARQADAALVFQMMPGQVAVAIHSLIGNNNDPNIGAIVNTPGERAAGVEKIWQTTDGNMFDFGDVAIEMIEFANPRAKVEKVAYSIVATVDPPLRFEFSHIEWFVVNHLTHEMKRFLDNRSNCDLITVASEFRVTFNLNEKQAAGLIAQWENCTCVCDGYGYMPGGAYCPACNGTTKSCAENCPVHKGDLNDYQTGYN